MKLPIAALIDVAKAEVRGRERLPESAAISTDTRVLSAGDLYVALRGERLDGRAFVADALARGACGVVVGDAAALPDGAAGLIVGDTLGAYQAFASFARGRIAGPVVAVTGSAGKTTTKEFIAQLLDAAGLGPVAATPANENNEFGVPKLFLGLEPSVRSVVVEFGARHPGDILPLAQIARPNVAVLTNIGEAHLEIMGSREKLATTKFEIFATGAQAVLNADDEESRARGATLPGEPVWFAVRERAANALPKGRVVALLGRETLVVREPGETRHYAIECTVAGEHNLPNVAAAIAAALAAGAPVQAVIDAIPSLALPHGRYERVRVGDLELIYDAYNASMSGTLATLGSFARENALRKIAVLGSMAELGSDASAMHERVGTAAAKSGLSALLVGGEHAADLARGARAAGFSEERIVTFADSAQAVAWLRANAHMGDVVLLKASRRYHLEDVLEGLRVSVIPSGAPEGRVVEGQPARG
jgi:UDP-N-acetylmuramoyl-tripeptide--D-alanyl-D-alanine ligase